MPGKSKLGRRESAVAPRPWPPKYPYPDAAERLRKMAEEQGTTHTSNYEATLGTGEHLWTDEEFEDFLVWLRESRRRG